MFSIIGLVVWAIVALPLLNLFQSQGRPEQPEKTTAETKGNTKPEESWLTEDAAGFFTFALVIVGIGQLGLFYWQLRYMREAMTDARMAAEAAKDSAKATQDAVEVSRDTAKRQLRAYITVDIVKCDDPETKDGIFVFHLEFKNTGQTPAHDLKIITVTDIFDFPLPSTFEFSIPSLDNPSTVVLGSQQATHAEGRSDPMTPITWRQLLSSGSGKSMYTYGTVTYRDVFGDPQYTNFCTRHFFEVLDVSAGRFRITGQPTEKHNDAS